MKTIDKNLLQERFRQGNKSTKFIILFPALFSLVCILIIPVKAIGIGIAAVLMCCVFLFLRRLKNVGGIGDPSKAYLKRLELSEKKEERIDDPDSPGNAYKILLFLCFGGSEVEVPREEYEAAQVGAPYYVAFYSENDNSFACFPCDAYEPAPEMELR